LDGLDAARKNLAGREYTQDKEVQDYVSDSLKGFTQGHDKSEQ